MTSTFQVDLRVMAHGTMLNLHFLKPIRGVEALQHCAFNVIEPRMTSHLSRRIDVESRR
jgi:hypothetical protein